MKLIISIILLNLIICCECDAYRANAHKAINRAAINNREQLFKNLGYTGLDNKVLNVSISDWIIDAGEQEDKPAWRTRHHFLDPVNNQGVLGSFFGLFLLSDPTVVWAQKGVGKQGWADGGAYSWQDARDYFHTALVSDTTEVREQNLADSFRALGQVMHLVADMSVPEHTRDTSHIFTKTIEPWLEEVLNKKTTTHLNATYFGKMTTALNAPIVPGSSLLQQKGKYPGATIPIANLYDSETYTGSNPEITTTGPIGLAEYTNAYFFSMGTEFSKFEYPGFSNTIEYEEVDPISKERKIFVANTEVNHLAQANVFRKYLLDGIKNGYSIEDDKIRADYMEKLIPRAVGYAGALVDYFYRGTLNVTYTPGDITFHSIKIMVENSTPNEAAATGDVTLVIRYKALTETALGGGKYKLNLPAADYTYKVVTLSNVNLANPQLLTFDFGNAPLPMNFADMTMQVVFKGKLGNEEGAVAVSELKTIDGIYTDFTLSLPPSGVYAKISNESPDATFSELRVSAMTDIPGGLTGGTISLALEYRTVVAGKDQFQSVLVDTEPANAVGYVYRIPSKNGVSSLPQNTPVELVFDLPQLPVQATDVEINIIYSKPDGTQMIGVRNISEPTPIDVFNSTDYTCLNGTWYKYDDPAAMAIVDSNGDDKADLNDIYPHSVSNISFLAGPVGATNLNASTSSTFQATGPLLPDQKLRMGYILTDYANSYAFSDTRVGQNGDPLPHSVANKNFSGNGFKNDGTTQSMMYTFRRSDNKMWSGNGVVFINPEFNGTCTFDALNQKIGL